MATENNREIQQLKTQMAELLKWKKERERRQLKLSLDVTSISVLQEAFLRFVFIVLNMNTANIVNLILAIGNSTDPSKEGQIVYHENSGTPVFKTYINGEVETFLTLGARGTVTQATSKSTDVTVDSSAGRITTHNASLGADAYETFTVNNTEVTSTDVIVVSIEFGGSSGNYTVSVTDITNGAFDITIHNNSGTADSDAVDINFAVIKITT